MPKPSTLLLILLALGGVAAVVLMQGPEAPADTSARTMAGEAPTVADLQKQIGLLEGQVEYLQGQVSVLQEENEALIRKLGSIGMPGASKSEPPLPAVNSADYVGLGIDLMRLRQLQALPVPTRTGSIGEVEALALRTLSQWQDPERAQLLSGALAALGWIPEPVDLLPLKAALLARATGAWLDEESGTLVLVEPDSPEGQSVDPALGVALAHLLREFGGILLGDAIGLSTDERLGREALLFGDASLTRLLWELQQPVQPEPANRLPASDPDHPLNQVPLPAFLRELVMFPMRSGMEFAQSLHSAGGFPQLDSAYSRPPISCAEVLETEKYLRGSPRIGAFSSGPAEVRGTKPYWDDELGQFGCLSILRFHNEANPSLDGSAGWVADRLLVYPTEGEGRDHACWQTRWRDSKSMESFLKAMSQVLGEQYGMDLGTGPLRFEKDGRFVRLLPDPARTRVVLIDAGDFSWAEALETQFMKSS